MIYHGLWTLNEGINQRNLNIWPMWQTKYASAELKNLGLGFDLWPCSESNILTGLLQSVDYSKNWTVKKLPIGGGRVKNS